VLLSTPLHASSNFTVSVQLANKRGLKQKKILIKPWLPAGRIQSQSEPRSDGVWTFIEVYRRNTEFSARCKNGTECWHYCEIVLKKTDINIFTGY
jgi:hypothetical protein